MAKYTVKLAKRAALLKLNNEVCHIKLRGWGREFSTNGQLITQEMLDGSKVTLTLINELNEYHNVKHITHIEMPVSRFTPDVKSFMEVSWEDE